MSNSSGFAIVQDRCYLSAPAYQGGDEDQMWARLREQRLFAPRPDIIFFLDVPIEVADLRLERRRRPRTAFETVSFLREVRERYISIIDKVQGDPDLFENVAVVDARSTEDQVEEKVWEILRL